MQLGRLRLLGQGLDDGAEGVDQEILPLAMAADEKPSDAQDHVPLLRRSGRH